MSLGNAELLVAIIGVLIAGYEAWRRHRKPETVELGPSTLKVIGAALDTQTGKELHVSYFPAHSPALELTNASRQSIHLQGMIITCAETKEPALDMATFRDAFLPGERKLIFVLRPARTYFDKFLAVQHRTEQRKGRTIIRILFRYSLGTANLVTPPFDLEAVIRNYSLADLKPLNDARR